MSCFPCFKSNKENVTTDEDLNDNKQKGGGASDGKEKKAACEAAVVVPQISSQAFTFRELATATNNFRQECLLGEGGFGRVYKGTIQKSGLVVAVKQLDRNGLHGNKEFLAEVVNMSLLNHPNLVNLVGYCADGVQRLLVYEFITRGTLEQHLFDIGDKKPLDWHTRMKIASGAASGLEYLHDKANPPVIYRDFKSSNVLLDDDLNPKLTDFRLANLGSNGDSKFALPSRVMGTYGYSAPEYVRSGELTLKSNVYSFGVVLLELITGRRAINTTKPNSEQNLVAWAQPLFKDQKNYPGMADPLLNGRFPEKSLNQAVAIAAMCLQEEADARPLIADIAPALGFLGMSSPEVILTPPIPIPSPSSREEMSSKYETANDGEEGSVYTDEEDGSEYTDEEGSEEYEDGSVENSESRKWASPSVSKSRTESTARGHSLSSRKIGRYSRK